MDGSASWLYLLSQDGVKEICLPLADWKHFELIHTETALYGAFFLEEELKVYSLLHTTLITSFPFKWTEDLDIRVWDDSTN